MSPELLAAVGFIAVVLAPIVWLIKSDMALGAIGTLCGAAITYFLWKDQANNWGFALLMCLIAGVGYVIGLVKDNDASGGRQFFWLSFAFGVFGALLPALLGLEQTVNPDEMTIRWGWIILVVAIIFAAIMAVRRKRA